MQERYVFDPTKSSLLGTLRLIDSERFAGLTASGAGARSAVKNTGMAKFLAPGTSSILANADVQYVVASTEDLTVRADLTAASGTTNYAASAALAAHLAKAPEDAGLLQVVPVHEAVA
jgi:hypothetical protein